MMTFQVEGKPVPKGRPRTGKHGNVYTPPETALYEELIRIRAKEALGKIKNKPELPSTATHWGIDIVAYVHRWNIDLDNLIKSFADALNGVVYTDDRDVYEIIARKVLDKDKPRVYCHLYEEPT